MWACAAAFSENLLASWGTRFAGPISILRNWTFCLFYVMAELWGSVVVSLLFWGFANQVGTTCSSTAQAPPQLWSPHLPDRRLLTHANWQHTSCMGSCGSWGPSCPPQLSIQVPVVT